MNKYQYLENLFNELQKYQLDSVEKHVNEYEYIVNDMLEAGETMDAVIEKLGMPSVLAASIAEEFGYETKDQNQFQEPIINKNKSYNKQASDVVIKIINILFIIGSAIYFVSLASSLLLILVILLAFPLFGAGTITLFLLAFVAVITFFISLYILALNLKRLLIIKLQASDKPQPKFLTTFIVACSSLVLGFIFTVIAMLAGGTAIISEVDLFDNNNMMNGYQMDMWENDNNMMNDQGLEQFFNN